MNSEIHLTSAQTQVLGAFRGRALEGLPPPTIRELCREFGWSSTGTARDHIRALVRKGVLNPAEGRARGACIRGSLGMDSIMLPLVGEIVAGSPATADQHIEGQIPVPKFMVPRKDGLLLRVHGDSMEGAGIFEGDLVLVSPDLQPPPGVIVAVTMDGETTLKRLERRDRRLWLVAENPAYAPIELEGKEVRLHGVVEGLLRTLGAGGRTTPIQLPAAFQRAGKGRPS